MGYNYGQDSEYIQRGMGLLGQGIGQWNKEHRKLTPAEIRLGEALMGKISGREAAIMAKLDMNPQLLELPQGSVPGQTAQQQAPPPAAPVTQPYVPGTQSTAVNRAQLMSGLGLQGPDPTMAAQLGMPQPPPGGVGLSAGPQQAASFAGPVPATLLDRPLEPSPQDASLAAPAPTGLSAPPPSRRESVDHLAFNMPRRQPIKLETIGDLNTLKEFAPLIEDRQAWRREQNDARMDLKLKELDLIQKREENRIASREDIARADRLSREKEGDANRKVRVQGFGVARQNAIDRLKADVEKAEKKGADKNAISELNASMRNLESIRDTQVAAAKAAIDVGDISGMKAIEEAANAEYGPALSEFKAKIDALSKKEGGSGTGGGSTAIPKMAGEARRTYSEKRGTTQIFDSNGTILKEVPGRATYK